MEQRPQELQLAPVRLLRCPQCPADLRHRLSLRQATSASRSLVMICSGVCRRRAITSPFRDPHPHIEGGPAPGGRSRHAPFSAIVVLPFVSRLGVNRRVSSPRWPD